MSRDFKTITNTINNHLKTNYSLTAIRFTGMHFDTDKHEAWIVPILAEDKPPAQRRKDRRGSHPLTKLVLNVQIFHKYGDNLTEIQEIANKVKNLFDQKDLRLQGKGILMRFEEAVVAFHNTSEGSARGADVESLETATVRVEAMLH